MSREASHTYVLSLQTAYRCVQAGDKAAAMHALQSALKVANACGLKAHRSAVFRAMNYVRLIGA